MPKNQILLNDFSGGLNDYQIPRDLQFNELQACSNFTFQQGKTLKTRGSFVAHGDVPNQAATIIGGYGLVSFESDYSPSSYEAVNTSVSTDLVFTNDTGEGLNSSTVAGAYFGSFIEGGHAVFSVHSSSGLQDTIDTSIEPGMQIKISGTAKNNGIYTVLGVGDSINTEDDTTVNAIEIDSGLNSFASETVAANSTTTGTKSIITHTLGENILVISDIVSGNLDVYTKSSDAFIAGAITPKQFSAAVYQTASFNSEYSFYAIDNVLRVSDGKRAPYIRPKWYGYVERHHFKNVQHSSTDIVGSATIFKGWYDDINKLNIPTVCRTDTSNTYPGGANISSTIFSARGGFTIDYDSTNTNDNSLWDSETWKIALSFVYDGNQESLLYVPTSNNTFTTVLGNDLRLRVMAAISASNLGYGARVTGGRMYYKTSDSETDDWILLCNIDLTHGVSPTLEGDKTGWTAESATTFYSDVTLLSPNTDSYKSINGYSPDIHSNSIGRLGEGWRTGLICNRRAFVANVRTKNEYDNNVTIHGDRILYSMPNKFDTFPSFNYIDVVKGDAEHYLKLESFADRLLAFKHHSVQIINVSSPSDDSWFLEEDIKNNGIEHSASVFRSNKGIIWANNEGCFLYNGSEILNLTENKINQSTWSSFVTTSSCVGYDAHSDMILISRQSDTGAANMGDCYVFDFKTGAWSYNSTLINVSSLYTNFITDYNGDLCVAVKNSSNIEFKKFSYTTLESIGIGKAVFRTKDIDFDLPSIRKKIYSVTVTYKSDNAQTTPIAYSTNGGTGYANFTGNFIATGDTWKKLRATVSTPITCQSIAIQIKNASAVTGSTRGIQIGDISLEYRILNVANVVSDT